MAEKNQQKTEKNQPKEEKKKAGRPEERESEVLIRIFGHDLPGSRNIFAGLTYIKGVSWTISNAICVQTNTQRNKRIAELSRQEIEKIESALKNLKLPDFLKNRRSDIESGETSHLYTTDLDFKKEFDIKRLRKIKSYRGARHAVKLPSRGQRTRSHFRHKGAVAVGVKKKAA